MTATAAYDYYLNDDYDYGYGEEYNRSRRNSRRMNKPGKNKRAARQARFHKETGYLTRHEAEAAEQRWNELINA